MHLKSVKISKFRSLEELEVRFAAPSPDGGNVVNVVAGVNGCGKTSLLKGIIKGFSSSGGSEAVSLVVDGSPDLVGLETEEVRALSLIKSGMWGPVGNILAHHYQESPQKFGSRVFFFHAHLSAEYQPVSNLKRQYSFVNLVDPRAMLGRAEFYIREYVLSQERRSHQASPEQRAKNAVEHFNANFEGTDLLTRLVDLDASDFNRPVFETIRGDRVTIDQLSDGEKQLYGRVVALMIFEPEDSIILIDEPEISLHPRWQRAIMSIYARIGRNNQFIVATHSPQIIAETPYQNLILMRKDAATNRIEMVYPQHPPSGVDVNSVLQEVMGAEPMPAEQLALHRDYRGLVESGDEDGVEGRALREQILQREADTSEFMQEMRFLLELRGEQ